MRVAFQRSRAANSKGGDDENDACCALGHEGDRKSGPEEIPTVEFAVLNRSEAAERDAAPKGEQHVHFADTADVKKAEGAEEDEGAEPGGECVLSAISHPCRRATIATPESAEPARAQNSVMPKSLKKTAVIQSIKRRLFEPGLIVPMGDERLRGEHLARDLGVDALVPVGEWLVAEQSAGARCRREGWPAAWRRLARLRLRGSGDCRIGLCGALLFMNRRRRLASGMVLALGVAFEIGAVEVDLAQIAGAVALCLDR